MKIHSGHDVHSILGGSGLSCNKNFLSSIKNSAGFIISWFYFQGDVCRVVRHFHFTTWPDFGVPDPPQTLVRFVRAFRERVGPDQKPIVVHCRLIFFFMFRKFFRNENKNIWKRRQCNIKYFIQRTLAVRYIL